MPEPEQPQPQPDPKRHPDLELQLPLLREEWRARELLELEPQEPLQELQPARVPRQPVQLDRVMAYGLLAVQGPVRDGDALPDVRRHGLLAFEHRVDVRRLHRAGPYERLATLADGVVAAGRGRVETYGAAVEEFRH